MIHMGPSICSDECSCLAFPRYCTYFWLRHWLLEPAWVEICWEPCQIYMTRHQAIAVCCLLDNEPMSSNMTAPYLSEVLSKTFPTLQHMGASVVFLSLSFNFYTAKLWRRRIFIQVRISWNSRCRINWIFQHHMLLEPYFNVMKTLIVPVCKFWKSSSPSACWRITFTMLAYCSWTYLLKCAADGTTSTPDGTAGVHFHRYLNNQWW